MWEFAAGNTFGASAFTSYGAFWISLGAFIWVHYLGWFAMAQEIDMFLYFFVWGCFSALLWGITFRISKALVVVFGSLVLLFLLLAIGEYSVAVHKMAGYLGIFCGGSAIYTGYATLLNETWKGKFLPLAPYTPPESDYEAKQ
mmetsp:Transcript_49189/g.104685  ORF Transcript_49189/g.104685 Transcript_49189/m.104685 type:complete len:143 (+) Transcript_49189:241-669(+)